MSLESYFANDMLGSGYLSIDFATLSEEFILRYARKSRNRDHWTADESDLCDRISGLMKLGHWTPFEFVDVIFKVRAPIYVASQWKRHRTWVYLERSMRYCEAEEHPFCLFSLKDNRPRKVDDNTANRVTSITDKFHKIAQFVYKTLIKLGVPKEQARAVLPQSMWTEFYAKANLRNIFHFLELRLDPAAQYEIRLYANAMAHLLKERYPVAMGCWLELNQKQYEEYLNFDGEKHLS